LLAPPIQDSQKPASINTKLCVIWATTTSLCSSESLAWALLLPSFYNHVDCFRC